jgi:predicted dehydrogenase
MNVAIVGCGLLGARRAKVFAAAGHQIVACADPDLERAEALAAEHGAAPDADWRAAVDHDGVDAVAVATTHDQLAPITLGAVEAGRHVLLEKPGARRPAELDPVIAAAEAGGRVVQVGFNHRYHPAMRRARELVDSGTYGPVLYVRGRYGHGGRIGYDKEWRADPEISGGGELLDQGSHLIDLSRWFLGDFEHVDGTLATYFWDMPVEDNAFMVLRTAAGGVAHLHASWTEWKNRFSLEITCRDAKLDIDGLGGSYGPEKLTLYEMKPEMGPPDITVEEFTGPDQSWDLEVADFVASVEQDAPIACDLHDARAVLEVVERLYKEGSRA